MNEEQTQQPVQEPKRNTKPLIIALIVLTLLAATGYAVYAWQQNRIETLNNQIKDLQKQAEETKSDDEAEATTQAYKLPAGYTEYKNTNPVFSFGYPNTWANFTITNINNNTAAAREIDANGTAIQGVSIANSSTGADNLRFLATSTTYTPPGTDETLNVYARNGYKANYVLANNQSANKYSDFEVVKTRSGEAIVFKVSVQGSNEKTSVGVVNLPASTGFKAIGFGSDNHDELKKILATLKIGN